MATSTLDAVIAGASASGTWRTVVAGPDGAVRCDSGPVAWQAAPAG